MSQYLFSDLVNIISLLRSENGCPWDRGQTLSSLKKYLLEETYETLDAIEMNDMTSLKEELGDILLIVVFLSSIAEDACYFTINDVINSICAKMIHRHPHVFSDAKCNTPDDVVEQWTQRKIEEGKGDSITSGVPKTLPSLMLAQKLQARASKVGFDWQDAKSAFSKIEEEIYELKDSLTNGSKDEIISEIGDLLFSVVNVARLKNISAEEALRQTVNKFTDRFKFIENNAKEQNKNLKDMSLQEMDAVWEEAKKRLKT